MPTRSSIRRFAARLREESDGSSDMTVYLLLTAAGAVMVCLTLPTLFQASATASRTFEKQVNVLERGADPAGGSGAGNGPGAGSPWSFQIGTDGVSASGPLGSGVSGSVSVGKGGVSGNVSGGGGGGQGSPGGAQGGGAPSPGSGTTSITPGNGAALSREGANQALIHAKID